MGRNRGGSDRLVHSVMQLAGPAAVELQSHLCNNWCTIAVGPRSPAFGECQSPHAPQAIEHSWNRNVLIH